MVILGLMLGSAKDWFQTVDNIDQIEQLIAQRATAKKVKNWELADNIRDQLLDIGVVIEDTGNGSTIWKKL